MEKLLELAKAICKDDTLELDEDTSIAMDMELSSMEFMEFITSVEQEYDIRISERALSRIDTLGDLMAEIEKKL